MKYKKNSVKAQEVLIALHNLYKEDVNRRIVRKLHGKPHPYTVVTLNKLSEYSEIPRRTLNRYVDFLQQLGIIHIIHMDWHFNLSTNCYAIDYEKLALWLEELWRTKNSRGGMMCKGRINKDMFILAAFNPQDHIKLCPAFRQNIGRFKNRKSVIYETRRMGRNVKKQEFETSNQVGGTCQTPLRGYLNLKEKNHLRDASRSAGALAIRLTPPDIWQKWLSLTNLTTKGELIYEVGRTLEHLFKRDISPTSKRRTYFDWKRPKDFFRKVGELLRRGIIQPTSESLTQFLAWSRETCNGCLTKALDFRYVWMFTKYLKSIKFKKNQCYEKYVRKDKNMGIGIISCEEEVKPPVDAIQRMEEEQYSIAMSNESTEQKEVRLQLLQKMGVASYVAWIKNLPFDGSSDYIMIVPSRFHFDRCTGLYEDTLPRHRLKFIMR